MRETEFMYWMRNVRKLDERTSQARLSNCRRIENYEGDLDSHYDIDRMRELSDRLTYTTEDERRNAPTRHRIPFADGANWRTGSATLKQAANLYKMFRDGSLDPKPTSIRY